MTPPLRVGVVGCGIIAARYVKDSVAFEHWRPVACADLDPGLTESFAAEHGLRPSSVEALIADPELELVLNLTPPKAHAPVVRASLAAGKHVYTEKPLAATRSRAGSSSRRRNSAGCASAARRTRSSAAPTRRAGA